MELRNPTENDGVSYRLVAGFDAYCVGDDGSLWSRFGLSRGAVKGERLLVDSWHRVDMKPKEDGYVAVCLYSHGRRRYVRMHVLVLECFVGPCPPGMEACHENGIRHDCRLVNLRWDTRRANHADKRRHGTTALGELNPQAKLNAEKVLLLMSRRAEGATYAQLGKEFNLSPTYAGDIITGKKWSHITNVRAKKRA